MAKPFYITTPIYYVNARPHLGHAYTTILADVVCRFNAMKGSDAYFLTGTDEHGDKIVRAAQQQALSPKAYADQISALFKNLWPELNINYSSFIRTTDEKHIAIVELVLQRILANMKGNTASGASAFILIGNWWMANARTMKPSRRRSRKPTIFSK